MSIIILKELMGYSNFRCWHEPIYSLNPNNCLVLVVSAFNLAERLCIFSSVLFPVVSFFMAKLCYILDSLSAWAKFSKETESKESVSDLGLLIKVVSIMDIFTFVLIEIQ